MREVCPEVMTAIDRICAFGCALVSAYIRALQIGEIRPEYAEFDASQRASLLRELQSIMSIYEKMGD